MMLEAGLYDLSAADYHSDPCPAPSLSSSVAYELVMNSPRHAWTAHPRLNPNFRREDREIFDLGTAAHAFLLQGETGFTIIDADDFRTKAAKEARDAARAAGKTPLLAKRWADVVAMGTAVNQQLDSFRDSPRPFSDGKPEQTIVWKEETLSGAIWCRARLDWLHDRSFQVVDDLKTTSASANPEAWTRGPLFAGPDIQAAFYLRGLQAVTGAKMPVFRFVVCENFPPFACSVIALGPEALVIAEKKVRYAIELWQRCLVANDWPTYPDKTCYAQLPPWIEASWIAREERMI